MTDFDHAIARDATFYVAGHGGLVGSAIWRHLQAQGFTNLVGLRSKELDLRDPGATRDFFAQVRPAYVIDAAARVGGILANDREPADFISDNLRVQTNLIDAAHEFGVTRLLFLGSSCVYPKFAEQPIREESLLTGSLEPTNAAYAVAKIAGIAHVQAMRRQHGCSFISAMPTNLYGPGDNFDPATSHVLPAMIRRLHTAARTGQRSVTVWGTGTPRREFLYIDDLAGACLTLLERYDGDSPVNVGTGEDLAIRELVDVVARAVGYDGDVTYDTSKPDGTPRKVLDVSRIHALGWRASTPLSEGIERTVEWYERHIADAASA